MISQNPRGFRKQTNKPVNINISFTINPKNILNGQQIQNQVQGRKLVKESDYVALCNNSRTPNYARTPDLNADLKMRQYNNDNPRSKRNTKRNSVDQTSFKEVKPSDCNKSLTLRKFAETAHIRKSSTKSKKCADNSARKHNKTVSTFTRNIDRYAVNSVIIQGGGAMEHRVNLQKNLKKMINNIVTNELSKRSLPLQLPNNGSISRRTTHKKKTKRKSPKKANKSEAILQCNKNQNWSNPIDRQKLIQKLTSFRSMNNSLFISQADQQIIIKDRKSIVVNTDQSIQCIDQIHQLQVSQRYKKLDDMPSKNNYGKAQETIQLIQTYLAILNQNIQYEGEMHPKQQIESQKQIHKQFEEYRQSHQEDKFKGYYDKQEKQDSHKDIKKNKEEQVHATKKQTIKNKNSDQLKPFCSSEMTKQQKLINQLQRIKLNQLKKHEVEKWEQLLNFMKQSMNNGQANSEQILQNVYYFLQNTRNDLQKQINKSQQDPKSKQLSDIDAFTNQLASNNGDQKHTLHKDNRELLPIYDKAEKQQVDALQFDEISSMSFKDEDYQEQNEELRIVNLQMIDNALKARHDSLIARREKQLNNLQERRTANKISQIQFNKEKEQIQKWTKQQTTSIAQVRKNIWKGYSQAKGILQKSARSKIFEEEYESGKKRSMMKCLSEDYLFKKGKNYLSDRKKQSQSSQQLSENKKPSEHSQHQQLHQNIDKQLQQYYRDHSDNSSQTSNRNKQTIDQNQLGNLKNQQDIDIIRQKLLDIKQKRLKQDETNNNKSNQQSPNMSYEQINNELHQQSYSDEEINIMKNQFECKKIDLLSSQKKVQDQSIKKENQKLKYICAEDKEDIFQFIFLDLSIELYQETCTDNKFMNAINRYVTNAKKQANKKKGVKTNLNVIKEYLRRFINFILRTNKEVLNSIDQPVGPTALQMLKYMHENDEDEPIKEQQESVSTLIIPAAIFDQFEKQLLPSVQFEVYYENDEEREAKRVEFLRSVLHIHNKALFDGLNEFLDTLRPYGIWGKPFPWKKPTSFLRDTSQQRKQQKLKKGAEKVAEYCSYVCGLLVDKEDSLVGNARLSQDYLEQIKEDRLSRMLATELIDNQQRWLFYDDEETEVLVELSTAIHRIIVKEATHEILLLLNKNNSQ